MGKLYDWCPSSGQFHGIILYWTLYFCTRRQLPITYLTKIIDAGLNLPKLLKNIYWLHFVDTLYKKHNNCKSLLHKCCSIYKQIQVLLHLQKCTHNAIVLNIISQHKDKKNCRPHHKNVFICLKMHKSISIYSRPKMYSWKNTWGSRRPSLIVQD